MITPVCQRWRERRDSYRPNGEVMNPREYEVSALPTATAKAFVISHHYSGTFPAARRSFALHRRGQLVGVAVFSHPASNAVLTKVFDGPAKESIELGRFVLLDEVPANGETWFLARTFEALRKEGFRGVVAFSDPVPRTDRSGKVVFTGHIGNIYQAHNAIFTGRGGGQIMRLLPDGSVLSARAIAKIKAMDQGWLYASKILIEHGAEPLRIGADLFGAADDPRVWTERWVLALTRPVRHPGNWRYAFPLQRKVKSKLPALPYPKFGARP